MNVKIKTEGVFEIDGESKRCGVGSVVEVTSDTYSLNGSWMEATDEPVNYLPPAEEPTVTEESDESAGAANTESAEAEKAEAKAKPKKADGDK